jgi:drug/metabolite transporter (DMT)-like permease
MTPDNPDSSATPSAIEPSAAPSAPPARAGWLSPVPLFFVFLWSTGFIAAKYGLPYAPPLSFLIVRCLGAVLVLLPMVLVSGAPWPRGRILHVAVAGLLLQAGYLGGVWSAIKIGMPAGLSALIVGLQPILTAFAAPLVGERVTPRQWLGLLLGLGGVGLVVYAKISLNGLAPGAIGLCLLALLSITCGTLYQKRFCPRFDLRTGTLIQFVASALLLLPFAVALEGFGPMLSNVHWTPQFVGALLWSILALSIGAIFLLFRLISRNDATRVTSLLYLTPPTTAVMAWLMFGEALSLLGLVGMVVAVAGVAFVVKK